MLLLVMVWNCKPASRDLATPSRLPFPCALPSTHLANSAKIRCPNDVEDGKHLPLGAPHAASHKASRERVRARLTSKAPSKATSKIDASPKESQAASGTTSKLDAVDDDDPEASASEPPKAITTTNTTTTTDDNPSASQTQARDPITDAAFRYLAMITDVRDRLDADDAVWFLGRR
ncbi:hypothetical protein EJ03DRAFT_347177 [Teratosphaeria nubilosa]|uniref:Uncharacterized protein n=1 Tax=Teratosphaeria nubilosa TaxID=161662 RepID=A0A6G1LLM6_9PEZI|nr:hypothetical protein EJ03DRAFT_347177 [Teratosphaeria nubilosa]